MKTKTTVSRRRRIAQILEGCQSLIQYYNVVQMARWAFYKAMDPTLHCKMKAKRPQRPEVRVCAEASVHNTERTPMQILRHQHRNRNRQLSVIVNIETDAQNE